MSAHLTAPPASADVSRHPEAHGPLRPLIMGALGVVFGDIGTSPLYAIKECFHPLHGIAPTPENALGILSLVFWSLILIVVVKYLGFVMRADNEGDGGILALLALVMPAGSVHARRGRTLLVMAALFGAALLASDGMITPAISVLGAVEGLEVATPALQPLVVPISVVILVALFLIQRRGTAGVGAIFGPVMLLWFLAIGALGVPWILREPGVLAAVNPYHAVLFMADHRLRGFLVLGAVVLCVTGAEALYADMGHFGRRPIRIAWYGVVLPGLLLNYFGQGALMMSQGEAAGENPFFLLAPQGLVVPLVALSTMAAVIASQALISGAFSLAQQAIQLGYSPRLQIVHTSAEIRGQIYLPGVNTALMVACVGLVIAFRNANALAAAYGIAVVGTMATTSVLLASVARNRWHWSLPKVVALTVFMLGIDLTFLFANVNKIPHGGWFPLVVGIGLFALMTTWKKGRRILGTMMQSESLPLSVFMSQFPATSPTRVSGTAVFMTSNMDVVPVVLLHHFKHNKVLHQQVMLLTVLTANTPKVASEDRVVIEDLGHGFFKVIATYGFMEAPSVPEILDLCRARGLEVATGNVSFFLGRETLLTTGRSDMATWRKRLFAFMSRNARTATSFFGLPPNRVVEMGTQIEL